MQRKKMTLRFDLDCPEDRRAWEYLQSLNATSINKTVPAIINQAEQADTIRNIIREELSAILTGLSIQPVPAVPACEDRTDDTVMDFLANFS